MGNKWEMTRLFYLGAWFSTPAHIAEYCNKEFGGLFSCTTFLVDVSSACLWVEHGTVINANDISRGICSQLTWMVLWVTWERSCSLIFPVQNLLNKEKCNCFITQVTCWFNNLYTHMKSQPVSFLKCLFVWKACLVEFGHGQNSGFAADSTGERD